MFDDPKKELQRLEDELLKAEMNDEEFERFYSDLYEEFGPKEEDLLAGSPAKKVRNYANGYGQTNQPKQPGAVRQSGNGQKPASRPTYSDSHRSAAPAKKEKGIKGLVITACCLSLAIVAIVIYWIIFLL